VTEREEAEMKAVHSEKLKKLQKDLEQQLTEEKAKIRYEHFVESARCFSFLSFIQKSKPN